MKCVLMQHGRTINRSGVMGTCCFNPTPPSQNIDYNIDQINCRACIDQENNGIKSYRQGANEKYGLEHGHQNAIVLDVTPNSNCNLACRICNENSSSSWAKLKKIKIKSVHNLPQQNFVQLFDNIDLSDVKEINFSGGEPFLNSNIQKYLTGLGDKIDFSKCILRFSTNGTVKLTKSLSKFFNGFQLVLARFSLDDIELGHEYQRWPCSWATWLENWQYFLDNMPHNTMPSINRTVSLLNINRLHLLDQWQQEYARTQFDDPIELIDHFAFGEYSLDSLTEPLKQHILISHGASSRSWKYIVNRPTVSNIDFLKQHIQKHDALQGTSLQKFDPDLYRMLFH